MTALRSTVDVTGEDFARNRESMTAKLGELSTEFDKALAGGGEKYVERHRKRGKMPARERIEMLIDPDTAEVLAMRSDMTPQVARIVATHYRAAPLPIRVSYEGSVLRRPRGRARRHRQLAQAGVECVGWRGRDADVEVLCVTLEALRQSGIRAPVVELAHAAPLRRALALVPAERVDDVADALARKDRTALQQCEYWAFVKQHWTEHNPSVTITYHPDELLPLTQWVWNHREIIGGMTFLPADDAQYAQAPYREISREEYEQRAAAFPPVDFSKLYYYETEDLTTAAQELACLAGACEIETVPVG